MVLSGAVPGAIATGLANGGHAMLGEQPLDDVGLWAVHPGGRSVLDAVQNALSLPPDALACSRSVLRDYGNMSSATILFVLERMMRETPRDTAGLAVGFGPGPDRGIDAVPDPLMGRFAQRVLLPELMDDPACGPDEFRRCLVDLEKVNRLTLAYRPTLDFLDRVAKRLPAGQPLRILDVGGGYGDMLRRIDGWASHHGIEVEMTSVDLSPWARRAGESVAPTRQPIRWVTADIFEYQPDTPPDVVLSSLFTHHLEDAAVVRYLAWMERTALRGWFVSDLQRHRLPWIVFTLWSRLAGWHRFVRHDGPVSIGRAFVRDDWRDMLAKAGITPGAARIVWWMPFRLCVSRLRDGAS